MSPEIDEDAAIAAYVKRHFGVGPEPEANDAEGARKPDPDSEDAKLDRYLAQHFPGQVPER